MPFGSTDGSPPHKLAPLLVESSLMYRISSAIRVHATPGPERPGLWCRPPPQLAKISPMLMAPTARRQPGISNIAFRSALMRRPRFRSPYRSTRRRGSFLRNASLVDALAFGPNQRLDARAAAACSARTGRPCRFPFRGVIVYSDLERIAHDLLDVAAAIAPA